MECCIAKPDRITEFFKETCKLVDVDKAQMYGEGNSNMKRIARLWSDYLGVEIRASDVAAMMVLHKVSRIAEAHKQVGVNTHDS